MSVLRTRTPIYLAIAAALLAVLVLPLSHMGADHDENCPLCNPLSHAFVAAPSGAGIVVSEPALGITTLPPIACVRTAHELGVSGRGPPVKFTT